MPDPLTLYLALCIGVTGRIHEASLVAPSYSVAVVANPVPLPRRLRWIPGGEVREHVLQLVPIHKEEEMAPPARWPKRVGEEPSRWSISTPA
jgi:hypothetical protein